jgi:putative FmdB family regulatory protein
MPKYTYKCKDCDIEFDLIQSIYSEPLNKCNECSGDIYRKIGKGLGVIFNGPGFYCNDK